MDWSKLVTDCSKVANDWSKVAIDWSKVAIDWSMMIPVEGVACCVVSALFYVGGAIIESDAKKLDSVTRVCKLKDLDELCSAASKVLPLVVAVTGLVRSYTPIKCEYSGLKGVIVEKKEERHILRRTFRGKWEKESMLPSSEWKEVPWYLDDGTGRLHVIGARSASTVFSSASIPLTCGGEVFEKSMQSPNQEKLELDKGFKTLGVQKIERVLPVGTCLTVVGQVMKDESGKFVIQSPNKFPFFISFRSVSEIVQEHRNTSSICTYISAGFGLIGVIIIAKHALQYMENKEMQKREAEYKRKLLDAAAKQGEQ